MNRLEILETGNTPYILFDSSANVFKIEGKSFPEDCKEFYTPVIAWLEKFQAVNPKQFTLSFNLFYLSSSSIISVKQLLLKLVAFQAVGTAVTVVWCYDEDDDDIKKTGEDYLKITKLKFQFQINP